MSDMEANEFKFGAKKKDRIVEAQYGIISDQVVAESTLPTIDS